ncbi:MAG: helix-turn-helix transcriptional regulator [Salibacteraceae bacterium]
MSTSESIQLYNFKPGLPQELELLDFAEMQQKFGPYLASPHRLEFYQIIWFQEGRAQHVVDFTPWEVVPDTVLFLPPNAVQQFRFEGALQGRCLLFTDAFFTESEVDTQFLRSSILFNDLFSVPRIRLDVAAFPLPALLDQLETELAKPTDDFQSGILRNLLRALLLHAERERRNQDFTEVRKGPDLEVVMQFREALERDFTTSKQVKHYAGLLHLTEKRLNLATSRLLGKSPKRLIDERVMLEAKRLLAHTTAPVKEIGFELGFEEATNFVKFFRKHHTTTPVAFRESQQA